MCQSTLSDAVAPIDDPEGLTKRDTIRVLGERRYGVAAVPVLNPVNMCDVKHTPKHSRADGCAHTLHVKYSIK